MGAAHGGRSKTVQLDWPGQLDASGAICGWSWLVAHAQRAPSTAACAAAPRPAALQGVQLVKGVVKEVREKEIELQVGAARWLLN